MRFLLPKFIFAVVLRRNIERARQNFAKKFKALMRKTALENIFRGPP